MATTGNLGVYLIGTLIVVSIALGLGTVYVGFSDTYGITRTNDNFASTKTYQKIINITDELGENVRETGIEDESSNSKIISVGWNSWKLFLALPDLVNDFGTSLSNILDINVAGIDFMQIFILSFIIWIVWTLIYALFFGRA